MKHKEFKPYDKVLVKEMNDYWTCDFYSHYNSEFGSHETLIIKRVEDENIIPFEGNEHLAGTTDEPEEEITIEIGEYCFGAYIHNTRFITDWRIFQFDCIDSDDTFKERFGENRCFNYAIRFSDFDPNDIEKTKKHILCAKDGKIVKYKNEIHKEVSTNSRT